MSDLIKTIAGGAARAGAPVLGGLIGSAIGGPVGSLAGTLAGKALETMADLLGVPPTPEAVAEAVNAPDAAEKLAAADDRASEIIKLWQIEAQRAADNDRIEAERGFGAWSARRTVTTYAVLLMLVASFGASLLGALGVIRADMAVLSALVGHGVTLFMAWNGLVSGGRAAADAVRAWRTGK